MKKKAAGLLLAVLLAAAAFAGCTGGNNDSAGTSPLPSPSPGGTSGTEGAEELDGVLDYKKVTQNLTPQGSCHDPSIFRDDDGTYYLFGTNSTTCYSSKDLIRWTSRGEIFSYRPEHYATGQYVETDKSCAKEMVDHVMSYYPTPQFDQTSGYWAPDIIKVNGKYRLYYCISLFGKAQSAIGFAEADSVLGPYTHKGIVVYSTEDADRNKYPNAIDPAVTLDKDGRMWMTYGSFFGGIYIIELDPATGFVKNGGGYQKKVYVHEDPGTMLTQGSCEGPYIVYNEETDYYYLFVSYGDLFKNYNVRVARSKSITGPYTYSVNDSLKMNVKTGDWNSGGNKILGGYYFDFEDSVSRMAPGHCSVLKDADGKWLLFNHVRNTGNRDYHYVQVHQLFFNEDGWPVCLPAVYAGETLQDIASGNLNGAWQVMTMMKSDFLGATNNTIASGSATLKDKKITGAVTGTFRMKKGGKIEIALTGNEQADDEEVFLGTYKGYVVSAYDYDNGRSALYFSAVNEYGFALWGEMEA